MRPKVFIGSSTQGIKIAEAIQKELSHDSEPILWSQGVFRTNDVPLESLMTALSTFDFAVFVLLPEDPIKLRGTDLMSVRDNVLFELGLFLGKLGRERSFFVAPKSLQVKDLHLPSDLAGITPSTYDPETTNIQAAIGPALFELKESIRSSVSPDKQSALIYKSAEKSNPYHFAHKDTYLYKDGKPASPRAKSELKFLPEGIIQLQRLNAEGRSRIELRQGGMEVPSILKKLAPSQRNLRVSCESRVDYGEHEVRFIFRNAGNDEWLTEKTIRVKGRHWKALDLHFALPPTVDLLFRIEDRSPSKVPSSLYIRNIEVAEEPE